METIWIYFEEQSNPGVWTLVAQDLDPSLMRYGWLYPAAGTYRFRIELHVDGLIVASEFTTWVTVGTDRTLTPEMIALLRGRQRAMRTWLFVADGDGRMMDRSEWLTAYDITYHRDSRVGNANVKLRREHQDISIAPELDSPVNVKADGSYSPAFALGRQFTIWVAQVEPDVVPTFADAILIFCGNIDSDDFASADASFAGRDIGGLLMDRQIEEIRSYGAPEPGIPMQDVIPQIIADNDPNVGVYVPEDIDIQFGLVWVPKGSTLEEARKQSLFGGADLRYLWNLTTFALTLYQPDRVNTVPEYVFSRHEWHRLTTYGKSKADIRNAVGGSYVDDSGARWYVGINPPPPPPGELPDGTMHPDGFVLVDPESIEKYGRRYAELNLGSDSMIRTLEGFQALQTAFILDLSEPDQNLSIEVDFFWPVGLNRVYGFEADGLRFLTQRNFACVGFRHSYQAGQGHLDDTWRTHIETRGKRAAALEEYLVRESKPSEPSIPSEAPPPDPNAMRISAASGEIVSDLDFPQIQAEITWTVANPDVGATISIDREMSTTGWGNYTEVTSGEAVTPSLYVDQFTVGFGQTSIRWRVRAVVDGETVLDRHTAIVLYEA